MKKIFTILAAAAMASALTVSAEEVEILIEGYANGAYYNIADPLKAELVKNDDGTYTLPKFLNSEYDFVFKFSDPKAGNSAAITLLSDNLDEEWGSGYENLRFLLLPGSTDAEPLYTECDLTKSGAQYYIYDMAIDLSSSYTYIYKYSEKDNSTYPYWANFCMLGYPEDNEDGAWIYVSFDFGNDSGAAVSEISADNNAAVEYYNMSGVRVENPTNGLFIRKQGGEVKKVMVK